MNHTDKPVLSDGVQTPVDSATVDSEQTLSPAESVTHSGAASDQTLQPSGAGKNAEPPEQPVDQTIAPSAAGLSAGSAETSAEVAHDQTLQPGGPTQAAAEPKSKQFGDYEIIQEIARGGMGVVYKARQVSLNRTVALKKILAGQLAGEEDLKRFQIEAEASAQLDHVGIVPVYDFGQVDGQYFFSMGFVEGDDLAERIRERPMEAEAAAEMMIKIAQAVGYANAQGVIHRDLKPSNVLLDAQNEPKVTDFGVAKKQGDDSEMTAQGQILGTPSYMPPEQAAGQGDAVDQRSDVYALGAILYALLTGRPPFQAATAMETMIQVLDQQPVAISQLNSTIPRDLETICLKCLQKDPAKRYASAHALADDLTRYLADEPIVARPPTRAEQLGRWVRKNRATAVSTGVIAAALIVATIISISFAVEAGRQRDVASGQRDQAELAKEEADKQREIAKQSANETARQRDEAQRQAYFGNFYAATVADRLGETANARRRLQTAKEFYQAGGDSSEEATMPFEWNYLNASLDRSISVFRCGKGCGCGDISPDGKWVAVGNELPVIEIRDLYTGEILQTLEGHYRSVGYVHFSEDGKTLFSSSFDGTMRIWDLEQGSQIGQLGSDQEEYSSAFAVSTDQSHVVRARMDEVIEVWDFAKGEKTVELKGHGNLVTSLAFNTDGSKVFSSSMDGSIRVWDTETGDELHVFEDLSEGLGLPTSLCVSPDDRFLGGSYGSNVVVWNAETGEQVRALRGHIDFVKSVAFNLDGTKLVSGSKDGKVKTWDLETGDLIATYTGPETRVIFVKFGPEDHLIISGDANGFFRCWDTRSSEGFQMDTADQLFFRTMACSPDSRLLALPNVFQIKIWDIRRRQMIGDLVGHEDSVSMVAFSPDEKRLVSASDDETLRIWCLATGRCLKIISVPGAAVKSVAFSPDAQSIASVSENGSIRLWDARSGEKLANLATIPTFPMVDEFPVAFSKDGGYLAVGSGQLTRVWNLQDGRVVRDLPRPKNETVDSKGVAGFDQVVDLAFNPVNDQISVFFKMGSLVIWDLKSKASPLILRSHETGAMRTKSAKTIAYSPDGRRIASSGEDRTVRVSDSLTGEELLVFDGFEKPIWDIAFSPDGKQLIWLELGGKLHERDGIPRRVRNMDQKKDEDVLAKVQLRVDAILEQASGDFDRLRNLVNHAEDRQSEDERTIQRHAMLREQLNMAPGLQKKWQGHEKAVRKLVYSTDGKTLITGGYDNKLAVWNSVTGELVKELDLPPYAKGRFAVSADGRVVASLASQNTIQIRSMSTDDPARLLTSNTKFESAISLNSDGSLLVCTEGKNIALWDVTTGKQVKSFFGHDYSVSKVEFMAGGQKLISGSMDGTVRIWNLDSGSCEMTFKVTDDQNVTTASDRPASFQWFPDSSRIAVGTKKGRLFVFDTTTGDSIVNFRAGKKMIKQIEITPQGRYLLTQSSPGFAIKIWDWKTGKLLSIIQRPGSIKDIDVHPINHDLVIGRADGELQLWNLDEDSPIWQIPVTDHLSPEMVDARNRILELSELVKEWSDSVGGDSTRMLKMLEEELPGRPPEQQAQLRGLVLGSIFESRARALIDRIYRNAKSSGNAGQMNQAVQLIALGSGPEWQKVGEGLPMLPFRNIVDESLDLIRHANQLSEYQNQAFLVTLATLLQATGETEEAAKWSGRAHSIRLEEVNGLFQEAEISRQPMSLNNLVWAALEGENWNEVTGLDYRVAFKDVADRCVVAAKLACELTEFKNPSCLDTLAQVHWKRLEAKEAAHYMERAIRVAPQGDGRRLMEKLLKMYRAKADRTL